MSARHSCIWSAKGSSLYLICKSFRFIFYPQEANVLYLIWKCFIFYLQEADVLYLICKRLIVLFIILTSIYIYYYCIVHLTSLYGILEILINHHEQLFIAPCEKLTWMALLHRWIDSWRSSILKGWEQNLKVSVTFLFNF